MLRGDLNDPKLRLSVGKTPVYYLNHPTDYMQWEISLRRLVTSYNMADSLLFTMPRDEALQFRAKANEGKPPTKPEGEDKPKDKKGKAKESEGKDSPQFLPRTGSVDPKLLELLGVSKAQDEFFSSTTVFVNALTNTEEKDAESLLRVEMWNWMELSVSKGPYRMIARDILPVFDIRKFYKKIGELANQASAISHARAAQAVHA